MVGIAIVLTSRQKNAKRLDTQGSSCYLIENGIQWGLMMSEVIDVFAFF